MNRMRAAAGLFAATRTVGLVSPDYAVLRPRTQLDLQYFVHLFRTPLMMSIFRLESRGLGTGESGFLRLYTERFGMLAAPFPPPDEQATIVRFLDHADRRIGRYIRAKQKLITLLAEEREIMTHEALQLVTTRSLRLSVAADVVERPIDRRDEVVYTPIGLFNRGRGIFHKEPLKGAELGDSTFYWIEEGDLVLSGQFAWEGAIALAGREDSGCVASHRYPVLRGKSNEVELAYLLSFFKTGMGHLLLDYHSRGGAGRNRPLNARTLMKEKIPVPPLPAQQRIAAMVHLEARLYRTVTEEVRILREYRTRLAADVVTGKLDVREAARNLPCEAIEPEPLDELDDIPEDDGAVEADEAEAADAA